MVKVLCDFFSQDVLANDENKIDYAFKLSMSIDIAAVSSNNFQLLQTFFRLQTSLLQEKSVSFNKGFTSEKRQNLPHFTLQGMKYLHNSPVKLHGNLASSRCMIDSHWVVSITDWGLHNFKAGQEKVECDVSEMYAGKQLLKNQSVFSLLFGEACKRSYNRPWICDERRGGGTCVHYSQNTCSKCQYFRNILPHFYIVDASKDSPTKSPNRLPNPDTTPSPRDIINKIP